MKRVLTKSTKRKYLHDKITSDVLIALNFKTN